MTRRRPKREVPSFTVEEYKDMIRGGALMPQVERADTRYLRLYHEALQDLFDEDFFDVDSPLGKHFERVEKELDQRELAESDDERVREGTGNAR